MSRTDVMSFSVNFTLPPEIIKEYFDGLAKVESSKKSSSDNSILYALAPFLLSRSNKSDDKSVNDLLNKIKKESKKEDKKEVKKEESKENTKDYSHFIKGVLSLLGYENDVDEELITAASKFVSTAEKQTSDVKDEVKDDVSKAINSVFQNETTQNVVQKMVASLQECTDGVTEIQLDLKTNDLKNDDAKSEKVYTDCYEELADLLNTDKRASDLLSKIKKDGNMLKLMQIINGTNKSEPEVKAEAEATTELKTDVKEEVTDKKEESKSEANPNPNPVNPLAGLASMFSGGQGGQGLNDMMKSLNQTNNPAIDNMMKSFGPVMEGLMGGNFPNVATATSSTTSTTSTTSTQKKSRPKTTSEILQELEKSDEVD
jgi:hypothetical protein